MIELIEHSVSGVSLSCILEKVRDDIGVEYASFSLMDQVTHKATAVSTYKQDWSSHYIENEYHLIDPAVAAAFTSIVPVQWSSLKGTAGYSEVFMSGRDFNIPFQGLTVPVRGSFGETGMLGLAATMPEDEWSKMIGEKISSIQQNAIFLCDRLSMTTNSLGKILSTPLSSIEKQVLHFAALGLEGHEIGSKVDLSDRMVSLYLRSARTKLNALTTPQAIGRAMMRNLIEPV